MSFVELCSQDVVRARAGAHDYKVAPRPVGDPRNSRQNGVQSDNFKSTPPKFV